MTATETPNAVETLREAAKVMRERADDAVLATGDEPWRFTGLGYSNDRQAGTYEVGNTVGIEVCDARTEEQAEYIASWHPYVALAVADWLDGVATSVAMGPNHDAYPVAAEINNARTVAKAYLGGAS